MPDIHNFEILIGKWNVHNWKLKARLSNDNEWIGFPAEMEEISVLNGIAVMDEMKSSYFEDSFVGLILRMVDPKTNLWTIYWAETSNREYYLKEQVAGKFYGN